MKIVEFQAITLFFSVIFGILGVVDWLDSDTPFTGLLIASFVFLLASNILDVVERIHIEKRVNQLMNDKRKPWMHKRQTD